MTNEGTEDGNHRGGAGIAGSWLPCCAMGSGGRSLKSSGQPHILIMRMRGLSPARRGPSLHLHARTCMPAPACLHLHARTCMPAPACPHLHARTCMPAPACPHLHACTCMPAPACPHLHARTCMPAPAAAQARTCTACSWMRMVRVWGARQSNRRDTGSTCGGGQVALLCPGAALGVASRTRTVQPPRHSAPTGMWSCGCPTSTCGARSTQAHTLTHTCMDSSVCEGEDCA